MENERLKNSHYVEVEGYFLDLLRGALMGGERMTHRKLVDLVGNQRRA